MTPRERLANAMASGLNQTQYEGRETRDIEVLAREVVRLREALQEIADVSRNHSEFMAGRLEDIEGIASDALEGPT